MTPYEALMIAPLSVVLDYRNQGVGSALLKEGLRLAQSMGYRAAFLCGNPAYYGRFGFKAIGEYGIRQAGLPEELAPYFMVHELIPGSLCPWHNRSSCLTSKRLFTMFSKLFFCLIFLTALTPLYSQEPLAQQLKSIIENKKATVGIAVLYNGKILVTVNDKAGYPMMSTFKFPLALAVLERLDKQGLPLETELFISKPDLHPDTYSPLREARPEGNFKITIGELLKYSVALSDNNACDILIDYLGGTSALQKYVRRQGIKQMKITATEDRMHKSGDPYLNHTRPSSAVRLLEKFIQQELLSPVYQKFLENTMIATSTGSDKLKGLLPAETIIGHKTGSSDRDSTGMKAGDNDMGFVYLPHGGDHYTIAVFITDSMEDDKTNAAIIAQISKAVYDYINEISS